MQRDLIAILTFLLFLGCLRLLFLRCEFHLDLAVKGGEFVFQLPEFRFLAPFLVDRRGKLFYLVLIPVHILLVLFHQGRNFLKCAEETRSCGLLVLFGHHTVVVAIDDVAIYSEIVLTEWQTTLLHFLGTYLDGETVDFADLLCLAFRVHRLGNVLHLGTKFLQVRIDLTLNLHLHDDVSEGIMLHVCIQLLFVNCQLVQHLFCFLHFLLCVLNVKLNTSPCVHEALALTLQ